MVDNLTAFSRALFGDFDLTAIMDQIVDLAAEGLKTAAE